MGNREVSKFLCYRCSDNLHRLSAYHKTDGYYAADFRMFWTIPEYSTLLFYREKLVTTLGFFSLLWGKVFYRRKLQNSEPSITEQSSVKRRSSLWVILLCTVLLFFGNYQDPKNRYGAPLEKQQTHCIGITVYVSRTIYGICLQQLPKMFIGSDAENTEEKKAAYASFSGSTLRYLRGLFAYCYFDKRYTEYFGTCWNILRTTIP